MEFVGIIPARYQSTRFPGKPLAMIQDKPMIQWVFEAASSALDEVWVATDDERIFNRVREFGGNAVMTDPGHQSGTDRCREAMEAIIKGTGSHIDVVVNIQGDEPFIKEEQIKLLKKCFDDEKTEIASLVKLIEHIDDVFDENKPKVLLDVNHYALAFSRSPVPFLRGREKSAWLDYHNFYRHIGIYAYRAETLRRISSMKAGKLELAESLEQLRWLENGIKIKMEISNYDSPGIDTPADLAKAASLMERFR